MIGTCMWTCGSAGKVSQDSRCISQRNIAFKGGFQLLRQKRFHISYRGILPTSCGLYVVISVINAGTTVPKSRLMERGQPCLEGFQNRHNLTSKEVLYFKGFKHNFHQLTTSSSLLWSSVRR